MSQEKALPPLSQEEIRRYSRHLLLNKVGMKGQRRLKGASVLIVGVGGLGSPVALYLAAAGVGRIGLVDDDVVDVTNLQRQVLYGTSQAGRPKVLAARERLQDLNPHITIEVYQEPFTSANAMDIAKNYEVLVDCSDNFPTRYLVNDVAVLLGKPSVYGAIYRFEGQVSVFDAREGPCYRCLFPEPPPPHLRPTCGQVGVLGVLPGVIGTLQATETLKLLLGVGEPLIGRLMLYDGLSATFETVKLRKNPKCKICGEHPEITELIDYEAFCGVGGFEVPEVRPRELAVRLQSGEPLFLLDVREPNELDLARLPGAVNIPLSELLDRLNELDPDKEIVVICRRGTRSAIAAELLRESGFHKVSHLAGGLQAWAEEVDPDLLVY
ncbi:MAG TPA: molybdopterin-synthase adenylyltransferase MoeB [Anaerolineaceae bacterium]|nr:molybdopterin-synthase adenylyltransferase MoeB [Anaerolineaceae bacterium]